MTLAPEKVVSRDPENYPTVDREQVEALLDLGVEALDPAGQS